MNKESYFLAFSFPFIAYFLIYFILNFPYLSSNLLVYDDTIFLPKAHFHVAEYPHSPTLYYLIEFFSITGNFDSLKLLFLTIHTLNIVLISIIFLRYLNSVLLPVVLGFAIGSIPIAVEQIIFVTGSHPTLALLFILLALLLFDLTKDTYKFKFYYSNVGILAILFIAAFSSPNALIVPAALPIWISISWIFRKTTRRQPIEWLIALSLTIFLGIIIYYWTGLGNYHYTGIIGWTEFSVLRVTENLIGSLEKVSNIYGDTRSPMSLIFLSGTTIVAGALIYQAWINQASLRHKQQPRSLSFLLLGLNALVVSALTFGPASITTKLLDRYLVAPVILGLVSISTLILYFFFYITGWRHYAIIAFLALTTGLSILRTEQNIDNKFISHLRTHNAVNSFVQYNKGLWPLNAQVVILTQEKYAIPTSSFNHWSTWYLRYLTDNPNIIGLLGPVSLVTRSPFVDQYRDHGAEYWEVTNNRSRRIQMVGLELNRPLFAYQQNEMGSFQPIDQILFTYKNNIRIVSFGESLDKSDINRFDKLCNNSQVKQFFIWPSNTNKVYESISGTDDHIQLFDSDLIVFNGSEFSSLNIDIPEREYFRISFSLSSANKLESIAYNNSNPPMPVLARQFAIYQHPLGYIISDRLAKKNWIINSSQDHTEFFLEGVSGCAIIFGANDKIINKLESQTVNGAWMFGRGFLERYWSGTLKNIYLVR